MAEQIYPIIKNDSEVQDIINKKLNTQRAQKIIDHINALQKQYDHYHKIDKRWHKFGKAIRLINLTLSGSIAGAVAVLGILLTQGITIPLVVMGVLGGYSTIETTILEGLNIGLIKKKKHKFSEKCNIIKEYINKMYFYYQKAIDDGVVTLDELEGFNKLVADFESFINNIKRSDIVTDKIDMLVLKKEAEIMAKEEVAIEMKEKLKQEAKLKLLSHVSK